MVLYSPENWFFGVMGLVIAGLLVSLSFDYVKRTRWYRATSLNRKLREVITCMYAQGDEAWLFLNATRTTKNRSTMERVCLVIFEPQLKQSGDLNFLWID